MAETTEIKMSIKDLYSACTLCPRECGVNRNAEQKGRCGMSAKLKVARAALHMWEEPPISGELGSGTVFFSGCPLSCVFCQNSQISHEAGGKYIEVPRLADIFLELQEAGAHNINLVTPTHFVPHIIEALDIAKSNGLTLPILYNCGGYESVQTLKLLRGYIDIYLPDFKYLSADIAAKYSLCRDYSEKAKEALAEMVAQTGEPRFDENGIMRKGTVVRHLVLPGCTADSKDVIKYLHQTYGDDIYISIMSQYTPMDGIKERFPELARKLTKYEYDKVVNFAADIGVTKGFTQYGSAAAESFIPSFDHTGV